MNIFIDGRQGTPITEEERLWIENEILDLKGHIQAYNSGNPEYLAKLDAEVLSCHDCGLTSFDRSVLVQCIEADIEGMLRCLRTGYVICW